ncbi:MAG: helix-turn-helix domain-containing protein [Pseudomonadota bacterium]
MTVFEILEMVAVRYGMDIERMLSPDRHAKSVSARDAAIYILREVRCLTLPQIGTYLRRDHTTIRHSLRKTKRLLTEDAVAQKQMTQMRNLAQHGYTFQHVTCERVTPVFKSRRAA